MIKKKSNWTMFTGPSKPYKPEKPEKIVNSPKETIIAKVISIGDYNTTLVTLKEYIKDNDISKIQLRVCSGFNYDEGCEKPEAELEILVVEKGERKNNYYNEEMTIYTKELERYKIDYEKYKSDLKEWKLWKKQETDLRLQKEIEKAEKLLKAHGKL